MQVHVAQENTSSRNLQSPVGVKQGSVLAPTLFSLYRTSMLEVAFDGVGNSIYIQTLTCLMSPFSEQKHVQPRSW